MGSQIKKVKTVRAKEKGKGEGEGEDRISNLPDDLIHKILSFNDAKYAVLTSLLSTRWRHLWKSLPHLSFDCHYFTRISNFSKFVAKFLRYRDNKSDLSVFNLYCRGAIQPALVNKIAVYGALHNLQHLHLSSKVRELPPSVFTSQTLKQLILTSSYYGNSSVLLKSPLILPALTTLFFNKVSFEPSKNEGTHKSVDLFSNLLNLKNLSLFYCETRGFNVVFNISSPQLENLHIAFDSETWPYEFVISAPKLSSFKYEGDTLLLISARDLHCLDKVYLDIHVRNWEGRKRICRGITNMLHQFRDAKFVTLTLRTIRVLSCVFELLENQPSPFHKMECLKIKSHEYWRPDTIFSTGVLTYLCNSSPNATIINECSRFFLPDP